MKLVKFLEEELRRKYTNDGVADMILEGRSRLLNPAYNRKFLIFSKKQMVTRNYDITEKKTKLEEYEINMKSLNYILAGMGGVGSNIAYNSQNVKFINKTDKFQIPCMDNDEWEFSNLPRIPFVPKYLSKTTSDYASHGKNEHDVTEPVFVELYNTPMSCTLPVGAPNLKSREVLWDTKIPWISLTHRDNEIVCVLSPEPHQNLDIARETYGMVDINFFIPAMQLATKKLYKILDNDYGEENEFKEIIDAIKLYKYRWGVIQELLFERHQWALGKLMYKYKYNYPEEERKKSMQVKDIHRWTFYKVNSFYTTPEGIDTMVEYSETKATDEEIEYIKGHLPDWNSIKNRELFRITEEDVEEYLKEHV